MTRVSHGFSTLGLMALLASLASCDGATGDGNGPSNTPPDAAFTPSCTLLVCTFADGSSDPDGQVTAYSWDFGDGTPAATTKDAQHTYAAANTYTVSLTVTDNAGAANGVTKSVQVSTQANAPPTANFTSSCADLVCSFTDLSSDGDGTVAGFHWDFGDGTEAMTQNSRHLYTSAGTYIVALAVTDDSGATGNLSQQVTVTGSQTVTIGLSQTSFRFAARRASGPVSLSLPLSITNTGPGTLNWTALSSASWLGVSPASGTAPSPNVTVSVNTSGLGSLGGIYVGSITVSAAGALNSPQTISVILYLR